MDRAIRAHYDGRFIVPDEPVDWPAGQPLTVRAEPAEANGAGGSPPALIEDRLRRFRAYAGAVEIGGLPLDSTRRESLYEDRW